MDTLTKWLADGTAHIIDGTPYIKMWIFPADPLDPDGCNEYVWVEVLDAENMVGRLDNEPLNAGLAQLGDVVHFFPRGDEEEGESPVFIFDRVMPLMGD